MAQYFNRSRSRGSQNVTIEIRTETSPAGCITTPAPTLVYPAGFKGGVYETMLDNESGNWKKRKGKQFVFNDLSSTKSEVSASGTSDFLFTSVANRCNSPVLKNTDRAYGSLLAYWCSPCPHQAVLSEEQKGRLAIEIWTKALAKRGDGKANYLETLAELDQAWRMVGSPFENLTALIKTLRRNGKRSKGYEKVAADSKAYIQFTSAEWLRFRYGISPVISDVKAMLEALETVYSKGPRVFTARAVGQLFDRKISSGSIDSTTFKCDYQVTTAHTVKAKAYWYDRYTRSIWNDLGFSIQNISGLAWELTRYSFVLDWFVNVGDVIYANVPRVTYEPLGGQLVVREQKDTFYFPTAFTNKLPALWNLTGGVSDTVHRADSTVNRSTPDYSYPGFVVKSNFRLDNYTRAADAVTIAIQWLNSVGFDRYQLNRRSAY